jgi:hypothetical protein
MADTSPNTWALSGILAPFGKSTSYMTVSLMDCPGKLLGDRVESSRKGKIVPIGTLCCTARIVDATASRTTGASFMTFHFPRFCSSAACEAMGGNRTGGFSSTIFFFGAKALTRNIVDQQQVLILSIESK